MATTFSKCGRDAGIESMTNRHFQRRTAPAHGHARPIGPKQGGSAMMIHSAKANSAKAGANATGLRVAGAIVGTLVLLLALLAIVRPEMMSMAMLHKLMSAVGL